MAVDASELLRGSPEDLVKDFELPPDFAQYAFAWDGATRIEELNMQVVSSFLQTDPMMGALNAEYVSAAGAKNPRGVEAALAIREYKRELIDSGDGPEWRVILGAGVLRRTVENLPPKEAREQLLRIARYVRVDLEDGEPTQGVLIAPEGLLPWLPTTVVYGGEKGEVAVGAYVEAPEAQSSWSTDVDAVRRRSGIVAAMSRVALSPPDSLALIKSMV